MRLIDADALLEQIVKLNNVYVQGRMAYIIDNQPTAYSVEKVVAELKEREEACKQCYVEEMLTGNCCSASMYCGERYAYNNAVMIVKRGGVE